MAHTKSGQLICKLNQILCEKKGVGNVMSTPRDSTCKSQCSVRVQVNMEQNMFEPVLCRDKLNAKLSIFSEIESLGLHNSGFIKSARKAML